MRIDSSYSNYYDYYYSTSYAANSVSNSDAQLTSESTDSSQDETDEISIQPRRYSASGGYENLMNMDYSSVMMKYSLQSQGTDSSEVSEKMEKIKTDMDSLKSADIDSMSSDEIKATLETLKADMEGVPNSRGTSSDVSEADLDSMSESELKQLLENIQEDANNAPEMGKGKPPAGPPPSGGKPPMAGGGMNLAQMLGSTSETEDTEESSTYSEEYLEELMNNLISSYDSTSETNDEYVSKVKESLSTVFNQQKSNIDNFSSMLFGKLDSWASEEETTEV